MGTIPRLYSSARASGLHGLISPVIGLNAAELYTSLSGQVARQAAAESAPSLQQETDQATTAEPTAAAAVPQLSAKAKRKEIMARAEEKGTGGEMDAYTMPKPEAAKASESAPAPAAKPLQVAQSLRNRLSTS